MKLEIIILLIIFSLSKCFNEDSIIRIPNKQGLFYNITTKYGNITYEFHNSKIVLVTSNLYEHNTPYILYKLGNMKNLDLLKLPKNTDLKRFTKNNNNLELSFEYQERDRYNPLICEIFYKTKYIDKMIYSIGKDENGMPYKFFGGTPQNITKNSYKYTFNNKANKIIGIDIEFNNKTKYNIDLKNKNELFEIKEDFYSMICLPENILTKFTELFLKDYKVYDYQYEVFRSYYIYKLTDEQKKLFPTILFKIENLNFTLNNKNIIFNHADDSKEGNYLFINKVPCNNFIFGLKFLELFDISEFNLESGEINLYLNKGNNALAGKGNNIDNYSIIIIVLSFFGISMIIILVRIYNKNKKMEYYNYFYDI